MSLEVYGFYRLQDALRIVPVSRTVWYEGVKLGIYPQPIKLGKRAVGWKKTDIHELAERIERGEVQYEC